jgi:hypothetical protein
MSSRRKTGGAVARLPGPSRRAVLAGTSAASVLAGQASVAGTDPTITAYETWLAVEAERNRLTLAWGRCETLLFDKCRRQNIAAARQSDISEARQLKEIGAQLEALDRESDVLLKALPIRRATSTATVIASLSVAAALVYPDDNPEAHGLIVRAVRDLKVLSRQT